MAEVSLRGHHFLCILGYRGYGYSPQHQGELWRVKRQLWSFPETMVEVLDGPDGVCLHCPYLKEGGCAREEGAEVRVRGRDMRVMERLGLSSGDRLAWAGVVERLRARVTPAALTGLCQGCRWLPAGYCLEGLRAISDGEGKDV